MLYAKGRPHLNKNSNVSFTGPRLLKLRKRVCKVYRSSSIFQTVLLCYAASHDGDFGLFRGSNDVRRAARRDICRFRDYSDGIQKVNLSLISGTYYIMTRTRIIKWQKSPCAVLHTFCLQLLVVKGFALMPCVRRKTV